MSPEASLPSISTLEESYTSNILTLGFLQTALIHSYFVKDFYKIAQRLGGGKFALKYPVIRELYPNQGLREDGFFQKVIVLLFASIHELGIFSKVLHLLFDTESKFPFFSCFVSFLVPVFVWFYFLFVGILKYTDSPIFDRFGHDCVPLVLKLFEFLVIDEGSLPSHFVHHAHFLVGGGHMGFVGIEFHSFMIL